MAITEQVGSGVHRVADGVVNWYLIDDAGEIALVDAGWPRSWPRVEQALSFIGRSPGDVTPVVLTHGHPDHLGAAEHARKACGAPVFAHRAELGRATGQAKGASPFALVPGLLPTPWRPTALGFVLHATARDSRLPPGSVTSRRMTPISSSTSPDGCASSLPPGHSEGHASLLLEDEGILFTGDALANYDVLTHATGLRMMPDALNGDPAPTRQSLSAIAKVDAGTLLLGHGDPFHGAPPTRSRRRTLRTSDDDPRRRPELHAQTSAREA